MNGTELDHALHGFGCNCRLRVEEHSNAHAKAVEAHDRQHAAADTTPEEIHARLMGWHRMQVDHHDSQVRVHARRADHAEAGVLIHSPDESADPEYMKTHGPLFSAMEKAGRLRHSTERA